MTFRKLQVYRARGDREVAKDGPRARRLFNFERSRTKLKGMDLIVQNSVEFVKVK
jgi:hypothetical protein